MPGLSSSLTALVPHQPVSLARPRHLADHQEALPHHPVAGDQLTELLLLGVRGQSSHAEPALAAPHADADLLVADEDDLPGDRPVVQHLGPSQPQSGPGLHPHVGPLDGDAGDLQVREGSGYVLEYEDLECPLS